MHSSLEDKTFTKLFTNLYEDEIVFCEMTALHFANCK